MSQSSKLAKIFDSLSINNLTLTKSNVSQATSITTAVNVTTQAGTITTQGVSTAANSITQFTVNHPDVTANSLILANIMNYSGSTGLPSVYIDDNTTGSFVVKIQNQHDANPLGGALKISYLIL